MQKLEGQSVSLLHSVSPPLAEQRRGARAATARQRRAPFIVQGTALNIAYHEKGKE
jgi:hypothetical protein